MTTLTSVGFGDITPSRNGGEIIYTIFTQMIGASVFGFIIANISVLLDSIDSRQAVYNEQLSEVKNYLRESHLPMLLSMRVKKYFEYYLNRKSLFDEQKILVSCKNVLWTIFVR